MRKTKKQPRQQGNTNTLRIIAGQWRGRKLSFATAPGLRPTPDRVRETLFNWLQGHLLEANCLDLFAGSGALGFEALSRGVKQVTLVENNQAAASNLRANIQLLNTKQAKLIQTDAFEYLSLLEASQAMPSESRKQFFDLIFLDPPFRKNYLPKLLDLISEKNLLERSGLIYLEHEKEEKLAESLNNYQIIKEKQAGQVISKLLIRKD